MTQNKLVTGEGQSRLVSIRLNKNLLCWMIHYYLSPFSQKGDCTKIFKISWVLCDVLNNAAVHFFISVKNVTHLRYIV